MFFSILKRFFNWVRAHRQFDAEFDEHGPSTWVFVKTWMNKYFLMEAVADTVAYYGDVSNELTINGNDCEGNWQKCTAHFTLWWLAHFTGVPQGISWERLHENPC